MRRSARAAAAAPPPPLPPLLPLLLLLLLCGGVSNVAAQTALFYSYDASGQWSSSNDTALTEFIEVATETEDNRFLLGGYFFAEQFSPTPNETGCNPPVKVLRNFAAYTDPYFSTIGDWGNVYILGDVLDINVAGPQLCIAGAFLTYNYSLLLPTLGGLVCVDLPSGRVSALGPGLLPSSGNSLVSVNAIQSIGSMLYAGGEFCVAGRPDICSLAAWNGTAWLGVPQPSVPGAPRYAFVTAIEQFDSDSIVLSSWDAPLNEASLFVGNVNSLRVLPTGCTGGVTGVVSDLGVVNTSFVAVGGTMVCRCPGAGVPELSALFITNGVSCSGIAAPVRYGVIQPPSVYDIFVDVPGNTMYIGGYFDMNNGLSSVAYVNLSAPYAWQSLGRGFYGIVSQIFVSNFSGLIYATTWKYSHYVSSTDAGAIVDAFAVLYLTIIGAIVLYGVVRCSKWQQVKCCARRQRAFRENHRCSAMSVWMSWLLVYSAIGLMGDVADKTLAVIKLSLIPYLEPHQASDLATNMSILQGFVSMASAVVFGALANVFQTRLLFCVLLSISALSSLLFTFVGNYVVIAWLSYVCSGIGLGGSFTVAICYVARNSKTRFMLRYMFVLVYVGGLLPPLLQQFTSALFDLGFLQLSLINLSIFHFVAFLFHIAGMIFTFVEQNTHEQKLTLKEQLAYFKHRTIILVFVSFVILRFTVDCTTSFPSPLLRSPLEKLILASTSSFTAVVLIVLVTLSSLRGVSPRRIGAIILVITLVGYGLVIISLFLQHTPHAFLLCEPAFAVFTAGSNLLFGGQHLLLGLYVTFYCMRISESYRGLLVGLFVAGGELSSTASIPTMNLVNAYSLPPFLASSFGFMGIALCAATVIVFGVFLCFYRRLLPNITNFFSKQDQITLAPPSLTKKLLERTGSYGDAPMLLETLSPMDHRRLIFDEDAARMGADSIATTPSVFDTMD